MKNLIPPQFEGKSLDYFRSLDFPDIATAAGYFKNAQEKLLDLNNWHHLSEGPSAKFAIIGAAGERIDRKMEQGDYIRIDIPGPGLPSAEGYDWVRVEDILAENSQEIQRFVLTLRPSPDPTQDDSDTAHFFTRIATSTFLIEQSKNRILIQYAGRNEVVNTENQSALDNFRNFLVGLGAKLGASYPQWKALVDGLSNLNEDQTSDKH